MNNMDGTHLQYLETLFYIYSASKAESSTSAVLLTRQSISAGGKIQVMACSSAIFSRREMRSMYSLVKFIYSVIG